MGGGGPADAGVDGEIPTGDPLMVAKFRVATVRPRVVVRERLLDRMTEGVGGPLTLVSAPAGSGKTVLVSSWVSAGAAPGPVTWVSLDSGDEAPGVFWSYVLEGLSRSGVPVESVGMPVCAEAVDQSLLMRLAATIAEQPRPVVLVLDDAEVLTGTEVGNGLDFVIRNAAPQLRVVVITRVDPPMPLHRYRVDGSMTEIRLAELAFTLPEAKALLAEHGTRVSVGTLVALAERTKGWAAGRRPAGLRAGDGLGVR